MWSLVLHGFIRQGLYVVNKINAEFHLKPVKRSKNGLTSVSGTAERQARED